MATVYIAELDMLKIVSAVMGGVRALRDEDGKMLEPEPRADCENAVSDVLRTALSIAYGGDVTIVVQPFQRAWKDSSADQPHGVTIPAIGDETG